MGNLKVFSRFSPNFYKFKRKKKDIKFIIIHYTGMHSEVEAINHLMDKNSQVSCHYLINQKGKIIKFVSEKHIAWHAGKSCWKNLKNLNNQSIGIELVNPGHDYGYKSFSNQQMLVLIKLLNYIMIKYKIDKKNIIGHSDIAPLRKKDPGEKFPWQFLSKFKLCEWHTLKKKILIKNRKIKISKKEKLIFIKNIQQIGYCVRYRVKKLTSEKKIIEAFQRRFRSNLISGIADKECFLIAKNLVFNEKNKT